MTVAPTPIQPRFHPARSTGTLLAFAALCVALVGAGFAVYAAFGRSSTSSTSSGPIQGSGTPVTQTRSLPPFTSVELRGTTVVNVTQGSPQRVVVHADSNLVSHVTTTVTNGTLVVGTTGSFATRASMHVEVTVPSLTALTLSGHGVLAATGVSGSSLTATLSGSGVLRGAGSIDHLTVSLAGSGDADLGALAAGDVHAALPGTGRIVVHPLNALDATLAGTGAIFYTGSPGHVATSVTGTGTVLHG